LKQRYVRFSPTALQDLNRIFTTIQHTAGQKIALSYLERFQAYCQGFALAGERGTRHDDIRPGLRVIGFERRLTLAFMVEGDEVVFLRIFEAGRNWQDEV